MGDQPTRLYKNKCLPKVLILSTMPFNKSAQSRYLDSCFHDYPEEKLFHIFSDARMPCQGHCATLYQIRDIDLLKARFKRKHKIGQFFYKKELKSEWTKEESTNKYSPKKRGTFSYIFRNFLWAKKYWKTSELDAYLKEFKPDAIFVGFSYDFFLFKIAKYYSKLFNIPVVLYAADDFANAFSKRNPISQIYRLIFNRYIRKLALSNVYGVFNSDAIKQRFETYYGLLGTTIYISSEIEPQKPKRLLTSNDYYYFGNLAFGRLKSIMTFGKALFKYNKNAKIYVYAPNAQQHKKTKYGQNIIFRNPIPYSEVKSFLTGNHNLLYVEGFSRTDIKASRYAMSTKVADYVCSGNPVYCFGPKESGSIQFFLKNEIGNVACEEKELKTILTREYSLVKENQFSCAKTYFNLEKQSSKFKDYICRITSQDNNQ